jgi:hypothetical protein
MMSSSALMVTSPFACGTSILSVNLYENSTGIFDAVQFTVDVLLSQTFSLSKPLVVVTGFNTKCECPPGCVLLPLV